MDRGLHWLIIFSSAETKSVRPVVRSWCQRGRCVQTQTSMLWLVSRKITSEQYVTESCIWKHALTCSSVNIRLSLPTFLLMNVRLERNTSWNETFLAAMDQASFIWCLQSLEVVRVLDCFSKRFSCFSLFPPCTLNFKTFSQVCFLCSCCTCWIWQVVQLL